MKKLDPKAVWLFFFNSIHRGIVLVLLLYAGFYIAAQEHSILFPPTGLLSFWPIFLVISFLWVWAKLNCYYFRYELEENGFKKESGVISKKYVFIPYSKIQNVDIFRGLAARILGLSDLHIQTAGSGTPSSSRGAFVIGGAEGRLPGLSQREAERLRDELFNRIQQQ